SRKLPPCDICQGLCLYFVLENFTSNSRIRSSTTAVSKRSTAGVIHMEKAAFIFCVEDRALFCQDCDESIHPVGTLAANHQRYLATGIKVALGSKCSQETGEFCKEPPNLSGPQVTAKPPAVEQPAAKEFVQQSSALSSPPWAVEDLFAFSDLEPTEKVIVFLFFFFSNQEQPL
ncbi:B-box zinc finger protein 24-like protein, partial [Drosera capensis]